MGGRRILSCLLQKKKGDCCRCVAVARREVRVILGEETEEAGKIALISCKNAFPDSRKREYLVGGEERAPEKKGDFHKGGPRGVTLKDLKRTEERGENLN